MSTIELKSLHKDIYSNATGMAAGIRLAARLVTSGVRYCLSATANLWQMPDIEKADAYETATSIVASLNTTGQCN
ncbi:MAG: hypothetical protein CMN78_01660 [Spirochaetales bacterium]|nr:hypothetical protein [Spirochaetales bacterium]